MTQPLDLPLLEVYQAIAGLEKSTGHQYADTSSYLQLIGILQRGYFLRSREDLYFLCEKIWLKPVHQHSSVLNRGVLEQLIDAALKKYEVVQEPVETGTRVDGEEPASPLPAGAKDQEEPALSPEQPRGDVKRTPAPERPAGAAEGFDSVSLYIGDQPEPAAGQVSAAGQAAKDRLLKKNYLLKGIYLPVSIRRIEQTIRSYRYRGVRGEAGVVDLDATLMAIARRGYLDEYEIRREYTFTTDWTLLIDHEGSMVAFHQLSNEIAKVAVQQSQGDVWNTFYFRNYPVNYLYRDAAHTMSEPFDRLATGPRRNILIISDAGAARGTYNRERIKATYRILRRLGQHKVAWLNPLPKRRWKGTSAEMIAHNVDMFEINDENTDDLGNIVRLFKSKINRFNL